MKRVIFLILLAVIGVAKVSAQEVGLLQENSTDARIEELSKEVDELSQKLEKLEEDYEYLDLVNQLNDVHYDVEIFTNNVNIRTNEIVVRCYNSSFDIDLYLLDKDMYDKFQDFYDLYSYKRDELSKQISNLKFSDEKQCRIVVSIHDSLTSALSRLEHSILFYKKYLDVYKKLGKGF
jgi:outer membrane murein-binding lipoprotein Lpp